jgi:hypothetical protein
MVIRDGHGRRQDAAVKLGDLVRVFVQQQVEPERKKFCSVMSAWKGLLPLELREHCRVADISSGRLRVLADTASHVYELRLCSAHLLAELQKRCPGARLHKIEVAVGQV